MLLLHASDIATGGHPWYIVAIVGVILVAWLAAMRAGRR
jgi:hypothetical protein